MFDTRQFSLKTLLRVVLVAIAAAHGGLARAVEPVDPKARNTGPWDLAALYQTPEVAWVDRDGPVRGLYYAGELYQGKPTRIFAWYALPQGKADEKAKAPGVVLVHGGGGTAFKEWAELWGKRGYAALAMDLSGRGPDGQRLDDGGPDQTDQQKFFDLEKGTKEAWPYHAVANVIRAHSLLRSLPEVDSQRTALTGISWGGYLTCLVASVDDRFQAVVPVYGCGFLHEDSHWLPIFAKMQGELRAEWVRQFDPSQYLAGCRTPVLFVNGTNDFAYFLNSYQKSYRLPTGPRNLCVIVRLPHGHVEGWTPREIGLFIDSHVAGGKPLARFTEVARQEAAVTAKVESPVPIQKAELHYTLDRGKWLDRKWESAPAELKDGQVVARLPQTAKITYFLTVTDDRGAVTSTEHKDLP